MHRIRVNGAWIEPSTRRAHQGGIERLARRVSVYASGAWRQYYIGAAAPVVSITPSPISAGAANNTTITGTATAVIANGLAPFTYVWSVISHSAPSTPTIANGTTAMPTFTQTGCNPFVPRVAVFRVVVTDAAARIAQADVSASFLNSSE